MSKIAFVSQSGNVMKSTLAIAMGLEAVLNGLDTVLIDLDTEHRTTSDFIKQRKEYGIEPVVTVHAVDSAKEALDRFDGEQLYIIDAPSRATSATSMIAKGVDLIIQPTTPGKKDIDLALKTFYQLAEDGVPVEKMLFVFTRVGSAPELEKAIKYINLAEINGQKIRVLSSAIWEKVAYRSSINDGLAITETSYQTLNDNAKAVIHQILTVLIK